MRKLTLVTLIIILAIAGTSWSQDPNIPVAIDDDSTAVVIDSDTLEVTITKTWTETYSRKDLLRTEQQLIERRASIIERIDEELEKVRAKLNIFK